ncbi:hypothetical protein E5K00_05740 [Hymenobacter aquaticus]|uniref:Uncharacterized protein n=1 Tax=Hymenobacter aquaticus TaxID=1867101 RepID=A0A4Z0Q6N4_9BACT|nr:hypothetical protein [Hymenobacter aquaticus]TGE24711.1 hypothetical protein E5K00_05740 [Hymenobacter aquaticus]
MKYTSKQGNYILAALSCLTVVSTAALIRLGKDNYYFLALTVCFGSLFLFFALVQIIADILSTTDHPATKNSDNFNYLLTTNGVFMYTEHGFSLTVAQKHTLIEWAQVNTLLGFKADLLTVDCICLDVFAANNVRFRISEQTLGWYTFLRKLEELFPEIDKGWEFRIAQLPFATNLRVIYDREKRSLEELQDQLYTS